MANKMAAMFILCVVLSSNLRDTQGLSKGSENCTDPCECACYKKCEQEAHWDITCAFKCMNSSCTVDKGIGILGGARKTMT
ncbi:hypothetical protein ACHQM5_006114 [Ranunculus cassubicifolius]